MQKATELVWFQVMKTMVPDKIQDVQLYLLDKQGTTFGVPQILQYRSVVMWYSSATGQAVFLFDKSGNPNQTPVWYIYVNS